MTSLDKRAAGLTKPIKSVRKTQDEYLKELLEQKNENVNKWREFNYAGVPASPINRRRR